MICCLNRVKGSLQVSEINLRLLLSASLRESNKHFYVAIKFIKRIFLNLKILVNPFSEARLLATKAHVITVIIIILICYKAHHNMH